MYIPTIFCILYYKTKQTMLTIEKVLESINSETVYTFEDQSSKNDPCESIYCEGLEIQIFTPNCNFVKDHEDFNTFLINDSHNGADLFETMHIDEVVKFINVTFVKPLNV